MIDPSQWILRSERMPDHSRPVFVTMDAGFATNPRHPGHATGGKWVEIAHRGSVVQRGETVLLDLFVTELAQTGWVTHWMELPALPDGQAASAWDPKPVSVNVVNPELEALRRFHDFFLDKSELLFASHGWPLVELFNKTAAARRGELSRAEMAQLLGPGFEARR